MRALGVKDVGTQRYLGEAVQDIKGLAKPFYSREAGLAEQNADPQRTGRGERAAGVRGDRPHAPGLAGGTNLRLTHRSSS